MSRRRLVSVCACLVVLFAIVLCRVFWIATDTGYAASAGGQTVRETTLPTRRGNFLDREGRLLTGWEKCWYALCVPGDSSYAALFPFVTFSAQTELYERRNSVTPFLIEVESDLSRYGITTFEGARRTLPVPIACHLIGYLDGEGHGVTGLEKAYDDLLYSAGDERTVVCTTSARGDLIEGTAPSIRTVRSGTGCEITLTLDANIQRACEAIAQQDMTRGCILVMRTHNGEVVADVSCPQYDPDHVEKSIRANDTSLIDRAFTGFSAGSVFKVVLAQAAYEEGLDWFTHDCTGSVEVAGETFRCAQGRAHGEMNLRGALEQSCNCYFIELGQILGGETILRTARKFGFGSAAAIAPGLKSAAGNLPEETELSNPGQLASLSFGQGDLIVTPLQITTMMNAVASDGMRYVPVFVRSVSTQTEQQTVQEEPVRVCPEADARVLQSMLVSVVSKGIGAEADPGEGGAGGKTGTAQTGQFNSEGQELLNYWFSGFWPAENPQYTITVLQDGVLDPEVSSAAIFARIAQALNVEENS